MWCHVVWYKVNILEESAVYIFRVGEDGGSLLLQNVGNLVTDYMFHIPEGSTLYFQWHKSFKSHNVLLFNTFAGMFWYN